ncbi:MAG TPA: efflux RND transporter periplasmic adaptor subunit [Polyangiaceae bacterium]|nr:efflux RND transporter periplasmic adaptor subunit [Polyangiaceae bacterium]
MHSASRRAPAPPRRGSSAIILAASLLGCSPKAGSEAKGAPPPVPVTVAPVEQKDVPVEVRAVGTAEAVSTVQVIPQVGGLIQEVHFKEGDFVKKNDLLFTIDTRPYRASLSAAQAELEKSRALAEQAHQELERFEKLAAEGIATQLDLSQKRANAAAMDATLGANRAAITSSTINVQYAAIRSPMDGRTGSLLVHAGNVVRATDTRPLVTLRTISPIYVRFAVPEQFLSGIRDAMAKGTVAVEAKPRGSASDPAEGTLTFIENSVDPASGKIDMKGSFGNEGQLLWPGQLVDVVIRLSVERGSIVIPESAVQIGQDGAYTYVVTPEHKAALRHIETSRTVNGESVVTKGLAAGESVVTDGQVRLRNGSAVQVKAPKAETSASAAPGSEGPPR